MNAADRAVRIRLEEHLDEVEGSRRQPGFDELRELAHLYRLSSAQLAILRSRGNDPEALRYLNALCVRAYTYLQVNPVRREARVGYFYFSRFPATLAATAWIQAILALMLLAGALTGATLVAHDPANIYAAVPSAMYPADDLEKLVNSPAQREKFLERTPVAFGLKSIFSAGLFVHNTGIGFLAFATGILAGIPTIILVFYNGITLGAFAWIFSRDANRLIFWAWLLPHAIPELLAITLCASAGLLIARAVLAPGRIGIAAALRAASGPALELVVASVPLFVVAASIESFLRQSTISTAVRFAVAAFAVASMVAYVWYVRRLAARKSRIDLQWLVTAGPPAGPPGSDSAPAR